LERIKMVQSVMIHREMSADFSDAQAFYACVGYSGIVTTDASG
jgi:hypothetical protein